MNILSPEAVTQLWDNHSAALVLYARQWCDGPEDVVQEAFLLLVRQVVAPDNAVGWLYRVVRNRAINAARSRGRRSRHEASAARHGEPWFERPEGDRLDAAAAADSLKHLPIEQREAIVARVWGGLSFEAIA
jgi:RNA polymerase sigma factor (sigma-70 family)